MKKIVVFGPRKPADINDVKKRIWEYFTSIERPVTIITSKYCKGWDEMARKVSNELSGVEMWTFEAYWSLWGDAAGPIRNEMMALECDHGVTGVECGDTKGTADMLRQMKKLGKEVIRI